MGNRYRKQPCAYCGKITGRNEGDHVVPKCFYPSAVDATIQWPKVSCCPECNDTFQKDEAHFKTILAAAGPDVTPERQELWESVKRGFRNPISGERDRLAIKQKLVPVIHEGRLRFKVYPGKDERVIRIVKKIIRGLCVYKRLLRPPVAEDRVWVDVPTYKIPPQFEDDLTTVYEVPNSVLCRADFQPVAEHPEVHSAWIVRLLQVPFIGIVTN